MFVDISDIINDAGVGEYVDIYLLKVMSTTNEYGVVMDSIDVGDKPDIENVFCTIVENVVDVVDSTKESYITRITYDFYLPAAVCQNNELKGATIKTKDSREFTITREPVNRRYVSHCVVNATKNNVSYDGGII